MTLPEKAQAQLRALQEQMIEVGDIWWLPDALAKYPGGKDRFCLVVALERPPGDPGKSPVVHFVVGSTQASTSKTVKVDAGSCGLNEDTHFKFWRSSSIAGSDLVAGGRFRGSLPPGRLSEIEVAIRASKLAVLKRLLP